MEWVITAFMSHKNPARLNAKVPDALKVEIALAALLTAVALIAWLFGWSGYFALPALVLLGATPLEIPKAKRSGRKLL